MGKYYGIPVMPFSTKTSHMIRIHVTLSHAKKHLLHRATADWYQSNWSQSANATAEHFLHETRACQLSRGRLHNFGLTLQWIKTTTALGHVK